MSDLISAAGEQDFDSRTIPVMREAVVMMQMILFRHLKETFSGRYQSWGEQERTRLAGTVVNNLFGVQAEDPEIAIFSGKHRDIVEDELKALADHATDLLPFLTDALRMQTICDNQEGIHSLGSLLIARTLGILQEERELPLPSTFMLAVRTLAAQHGLVEPIKAAPPPEDLPV
ncbi:MAG: hypothetical protein GQ559_12320 [Desulfobulbaceae bacterium]|nr:hypothetical protein [Desulfobulbaceae bacterium]